MDDSFGEENPDAEFECSSGKAQGPKTKFWSRWSISGRYPLFERHLSELFATIKKYNVPIFKSGEPMLMN